MTLGGVTKIVAHMAPKSGPMRRLHNLYKLSTLQNSVLTEWAK